MGAPLGSLTLTALATGGRPGTGARVTLAGIGVAFTLVTLAQIIRWRRTRYRVTADSFELCTGLLTRRLRTVPLHRIRNVDLTANPVHRIFGLTVLRAATTGSSDDRHELTLEALTRPDAERLRSELLAHAASTDADDPVLATADPRWLRYAPLTFWVFGGVFAAAGSSYRALDAAGIEPWRIGFVRRSFEEFGNSALWITIPLALLAVGVLGSAGAIVLYAENWWKYRLEWADADTLRVRRGLLTTRSVSIERSQLRGVTLREPLLLRAGGGATVRAVAGGLGDRDENRKRSVVLPPAPRAQALRTCAGILHSPESPLEQAEFTPHPRVALRRRLVRAVVWAILPTAVTLTVLGVLLTPVLLYCALAFVVLAAPVAYGLARDAHRSLGHTVCGRHLVIRSGTFSRDTVALRRDAVIGWTFTRTPFSRRAGVLTATAAVAAGEQGYRIPDMAADEAVGFVNTVSPGLLDEFLDDESPDRPARQSANPPRRW